MGSLPTMETLKRRELWEWVHESLRDAIIAGELGFNMRLGEDEIAVRLGVSRWPVRQAITRLEQEHLVVRQPHRGAFVTPPSHRAVHQIYSLRILLECYAVHEGFSKITGEFIACQKRLLDEQAEAAEKKNYLLYSKLDVEFHRNIVLLAESQYLLELWTQLLPFIQMLQVLVAKDHPDPDSGIRGRHDPIVQALEMRDPAKINAALQHHLSDSEASALRICGRQEQA